MRDIVGRHVAQLPKHERYALWLQTEEGSRWARDWAYVEPDEREEAEVFHGTVISYLMHKHVYVRAADWANARIRAYRERDYLED